jgi:NAD(P)-dependent dehydrogenase (short-subunit alcohol dehydrogenase family)
MRFRDQRILITGGTRGIGLACARAFAQEGARVAMNFVRRQEDASSALASLEGSGHCVLQADLSRRDEAAGLVSRAVEGLGGLDVLVNNAGVSILHPFESTSEEAWGDAFLATIEANLLGPAYVSIAAAKHMQARGGGRIVAVSSRGAFRGEPIKPGYGASKAGLNALHQSLAQALAPHGIAVGIVAPGFVATELSRERLAGAEGDGIRAQSGFGRVARPEEVAHAVLFLADERSAFSTGSIIDVNGASYLRS